MPDRKPARYQPVEAGESFAGGILTKEGAAEVNGARANVASGKEENTVGEKLFRFLTARVLQGNNRIPEGLGRNLREAHQRLTKGENEIFPGR